MKKFTKLSLCTALLAGSLATTAQAETATDTIDVYAGLAAVMELSCTDVNFGVWRVPTGTRTGIGSGATTITLDALDNTSITDGSTNNVALSSSNRLPSAGTCGVTGSAAADDVVGTVAFASATGSFVTNDGSGFEGEDLAAPETVVSDFTYSLVTNTPAAMLGGVSGFKIHGSISIPDGLVTNNYGGYQSPSITVTFDDVP